MQLHQESWQDAEPARPQAGQTNPQIHIEEDGCRPGEGESEDRPRTTTLPGELTLSHERQLRTQTHWPPTRRRTWNRGSGEGEVLRGPTQKKKAVEATPIAEEVEAQKLKAADADAEHHEAVRQLKGRQTPDEEG